MEDGNRTTSWRHTDYLWGAALQMQGTKTAPRVDWWIRPAIQGGPAVPGGAPLAETVQIMVHAHWL